jgi:hypothetical protein
MAKTQSQTVIVNVKQEKEKKPKRKRRSTKKGTKASPGGVSQVSQNQSVQPIYRGVQEPGIQQRFLAPDPQTTRVLNDLSSALQTFRQQSIPQPPPPSTAVIVSPPVGAMPTTPIAPRPINSKATQKIQQAKMLVQDAKTLYPNLPKNRDGTISKSSPEFKKLSKDLKDLVLMQQVREKPKPRRREPETEYETIDEDEEPPLRPIPPRRRNARAPAPAPEPEPSMTKLSEPVRVPAPAPMTNLRTATPSTRVAMLVNNTAAQLYPTLKLGQPQVQQNDIDDALQEID